MQIRLMTLLLVGLASFSSPLAQAETKRCVALRGNGHYVPTHFAGMARIVEDHGVIEGLAGSSSSTLTSFVYDAMLGNPMIMDQPEDVQRRRLALLLKSTYGLIDAMDLRGTVFLLGEEYYATHRELLRGILPPVLVGTEFDYRAKMIEAYDLASSFQRVQRIEKVSIVNSEFIEFAFSNEGGREFHIAQARDAIKNLSSFRVKSPVPLVRPGPFNFQSFGPLSTKLADFYALRNVDEDVEKRFKIWMEQCEQKTAGLSWRQILHHPRNHGIRMCVGDFYRIAIPALKSHRDFPDTPAFARKMGENVDVLISTGVIKGEAGFGRIRQLKRNFWGGEIPESLGVDYEDLYFGYWASSEALLETTENNLRRLYPSDEKSRKFLPLGGKQAWNIPLQFSPAEPGLSEALEIDTSDKLVSIGGWSDLHPVQVLKASGCTEVYYLTRQGTESDLSIDMVNLFDGGKDNAPDLYYIETEEGDERIDTDDIALVSSARRAVMEVSGGVLCTQWGDPKFSGNDLIALGEDSYHAEMVYPAERGLPISNKYGRKRVIASDRVHASCRPGQ